MGKINPFRGLSQRQQDLIIECEHSAWPVVNVQQMVISLLPHFADFFPRHQEVLKNREVAEATGTGGETRREEVRPGALA